MFSVVLNVQSWLYIAPAGDNRISPAGVSLCCVNNNIMFTKLLVAIDKHGKRPVSHHLFQYSLRSATPTIHLFFEICTTKFIYARRFIHPRVNLSKNLFKNFLLLIDII